MFGTLCCLLPLTAFISLSLCLSFSLLFFVLTVFSVCLHICYVDGVLGMNSQRLCWRCSRSVSISTVLTVFSVWLHICYVDGVLGLSPHRLCWRCSRSVSASAVLPVFSVCLHIVCHIAAVYLPHCRHLVGVTPGLWSAGVWGSNCSLDTAWPVDVCDNSYYFQRNSGVVPTSNARRR